MSWKWLAIGLLMAVGMAGCRAHSYTAEDLNTILPGPGDIPGFSYDARESAELESPVGALPEHQPREGRIAVFYDGNPKGAWRAFLVSTASLYKSSRDAAAGVAVLRSEFLQEELGVENPRADPSLGEQSAILYGREGGYCGGLLAWRYRNLVLLVYALGDCRVIPIGELREVADGMNKRAWWAAAHLALDI